MKGGPWNPGWKEKEITIREAKEQRMRIVEIIKRRTIGEDIVVRGDYDLFSS